MTGTIDLGLGVTYSIDDAARMVTTRYPDGHETTGWREETPQNFAEAEDQGYAGPEAVWCSLVEHECLHTMVSRAVFGRESLVLRLGREPARYALRLHEEALVISLQRLMNTGRADPIIGKEAHSLRELGYRARRMCRAV
jgi:hypothetical protein